MHDMIVVLPGITGSVLVDERGKDIWAPSGGALWSYVHSLGESLERLRVADHAIGTDAPAGDLRAMKLAPDFHGVFGLGKIDGYTALLSMIQESFDLAPDTGDHKTPANYFEFPYDWRLSNRTTAKALKALIDERLPFWRQSDRGGRSAKVILIAHSMGGLVSRYYLEVLGGWRDCRALITFGTPYRGSVDSLGYLANGYKKTLVDLTSALRSMPSVYELLPLWPVVKHQDAFHRITEFDSIPNVNRDRALDARRFHDEIANAVKSNSSDPDYSGNRYKIFPVVGFDQPTLQSATFDGRELHCLTDRPDIVDVALQGGDGTVPRVSATPIEMSDEHREQFFAEKHGSLQNNTYALEDLRERLRQMQAPSLKQIQGTWRSTEAAERPTISLGVDDLYLPDEPVQVSATLNRSDSDVGGLIARIERRDVRMQLADFSLQRDANRYCGTLEALPAGSYRIRIFSTQGGPKAPKPVSDVFEVAAAS
jgi:pimeloyl-ACP methyl ester carboxylesterase